MPVSVNIPLERAWNSWSSRPAEMVFLPFGLRLTPLAFAASTGKACLFEPGDAVTLGRHALDASLVELQLSHAGTTLDWRYAKPDPFSLTGSWQTAKAGEWGLRFWINLCLSSDSGEEVRFDETQGAAVIRVGHRFAALVSEEPPVQVTGHASLADAVQDYETHGYFHTRSRAGAAPVLVLRFNLEMMRDNRFTLAMADRQDLAIAQARALLAQPEIVPPQPVGEPAAALAALRDVVAWNTVWDAINQRPYTAISRNWDLGKFGGFGVWLNDQFYAALMAGELDAGLARDNLAAVFSGATPQGNLPCLLTASDAWVDRSQSPIGGFVVWQLYLRHRARDLIEGAYATLARNHAWWWRERDPGGTGLASFGTSDVGEGLYKGTHFGARNESAMDNSPVHDEARYDKATRTLDLWDVGLNSLLALDAEMLALMAAELGLEEEAAAHAVRSEATKDLIRETLWDGDRGIFANRRRGGGFVKSLAPTSFYPMLAGAATPEQVDRLCQHLDDPTAFGGDPVIPGVSRTDPAFGDNSYWRGRIWPPFNYLVYHGLRRYGLDERASALAQRSFALFHSVWESRRICPENYNAETGEPLDQPDTERFYSWGALMAKLGIAAATDVTPWHGWEIANPGEEGELGPFASPLGPVRLAISQGRLSLIQGERTVLDTDVAGRISQLSMMDGMLSLRLPPLERACFLRFPHLHAGMKPRASLDGEAVATTEEGGILVHLPASAKAADFELRWRAGVKHKASRS